MTSLQVLPTSRTQLRPRRRKKLLYSAKHQRHEKRPSCCRPRRERPTNRLVVFAQRVAGCPSSDVGRAFYWRGDGPNAVLVLLVSADLYVPAVCRSACRVPEIGYRRLALRPSARAHRCEFGSLSYASLCRRYSRTNRPMRRGSVMLKRQHEPFRLVAHPRPVIDRIRHDRSSSFSRP